MNKEAILTNLAPAPIGPYSQAVKTGDFIFYSGQIPLDPVTGAVVGEGNVEIQANQVMKNIQALLTHSGLTFSNIVKTTIFLKNMSDFPKINPIYGEYVTQPYPARSTVEVARLPKDVLIEIEIIART